MGALVAVRWMDGCVPGPGADAMTGVVLTGVVVVGVRGQPDREMDREQARHSIRAALRAALAEHAGVAPERVGLHTVPGRAPWALVDEGGAERRVHLAISHDEPLSVAAFRFDGPVGIDLMRVTDFPDWQAVARDYLGPRSAAALAALPAPARPAAFARAWSAHEARLKCLGLPLSEWHAGLEAALMACPCVELADLPQGYVGSLALAPAPRA